MRKVYRTFILLGLSVLMAPLPVVHASELNPATHLAHQRQDFRDALNAIETNHIDVYQQLLSGLEDYPLYGYLRYEYLRRHLAETPDKEVRDFLQRFADTPLPPRLHYAWLYVLGREHHWETFLREYQGGGSAKLQCYALQARYRSGQHKGLEEKIKKMWLVGYSQPKECNPVFDQWIHNGGLTRKIVWQRIRLAMDNRRLSLARYLKRYLSKRDRIWVDRWIQMHRHPAKMLRRSVFRQDAPIVRDIVWHGIKRLARLDEEEAYKKWQDIKTKYSFDSQRVIELDRHLALKAAYRHNQKAELWLSALPADDEPVAIWRVRASLENRNWPAALSWIDALPADMLNTSQWQYWRGRVLQQLSVSENNSQPDTRLGRMAEKTFNSIADQRSYYGFLAADKLDRNYKLGAQSIQYDEKELAKLMEIPALIRAYELFRLDMIIEARREWWFAIQQMNERELQLAAVLAYRWQWYDRAIVTLAQSGHKDDLDLRFPFAYQEQVLSSAKRHQIDPAWVYGVVRQESAFMPDARSRAGAMGLMQLLPRTARITARLLRIPMRSKYELLEAEKNLHLGSGYLKRMLDENNGNQILATASYNAGPQRVKQWLPDTDMPADLWVEMIPFSETRDYVRNVMAYTAIFDQRLDGNLIPLSKRMPAVTPLGEK